MTHPYASTVGLFGTCGNSLWRKPFIERFSALQIPFFNPQFENWDPSCAVLEADHLAHDGVVLLSVTDETTASGSLAETGFSILSVLRAASVENAPRFLIIHIDPKCSVVDPVAKKDSERARTLIIAHLKEVKQPNILVVRDLDEMMAKAIEAHHILIGWESWRRTTG